MKQYARLGIRNAGLMALGITVVVLGFVFMASRPSYDDPYRTVGVVIGLAEMTIYTLGFFYPSKKIQPQKTS